MRKVDFGWLLPVCMVLIIGLVGVVLYKALDWLQTPPAAEVALTDAWGCGVVDPVTVSAATALDTSVANYESIAAGDALFKGNCAQCHAVNDVVVGPALAGITRRRPTAWLVRWVKNSSKVVASGDEYAMKLFNQYQKQQMPSFQLSEAEIKDIMAYIETQEAGVAVASAVAMQQ